MLSKVLKRSHQGEEHKNFSSYARITMSIVYMYIALISRTKNKANLLGTIPIPPLHFHIIYGNPLRAICFALQAFYISRKIQEFTPATKWNIPVNGLNYTRDVIRDAIGLQHCREEHVRPSSVTIVTLTPLHKMEFLYYYATIQIKASIGIPWGIGYERRG